MEEESKGRGKEQGEAKKYISKYEEMQQFAAEDAGSPEDTPPGEAGAGNEGGGATEAENTVEDDFSGSRQQAEENSSNQDKPGTEDLGDKDQLVVEKVEFPSLEGHQFKAAEVDVKSFKDITLPVSAELGKTHLKVRDLINLEKGSLLKLSRLADESINVLVNEVPLAQGEVVVINERFGVRIVSFLGEQEESDKDRQG